MKKYLLFIIIVYNACQPRYEGIATKAECDKFRTGRFLHESQGDPTIYRIERSDSIQTEFIGKSGDLVNLNIRWTGSCTYELTFLNQTIKGSDSVAESVQKSMKVMVKITEVRNDTCFVIADSGEQAVRGIVYIDKR